MSTLKEPHEPRRCRALDGGCRVCDRGAAGVADCGVVCEYDGDRTGSDRSCDCQNCVVMAGVTSSVDPLLRRMWEDGKRPSSHPSIGAEGVEEAVAARARRRLALPRERVRSRGDDGRVNERRTDGTSAAGFIVCDSTDEACGTEWFPDDRARCS